MSVALFAPLAGLFAVALFFFGVWLGDRLRVESLLIGSCSPLRHPHELHGQLYYIVPAAVYERLTLNALMTVIDDDEEEE